MSKQFSATLPPIKKERTTRARRLKHSPITNHKSPTYDGQPMSVLAAAFFAAIARGNLITQLNKTKNR